MLHTQQILALKKCQTHTVKKSVLQRPRGQLTTTVLEIITVEMNLMLLLLCGLLTCQIIMMDVYLWPQDIRNLKHRL